MWGPHFFPSWGGEGGRTTESNPEGESPKYLWKFPLRLCTWDLVKK